MFARTIRAKKPDRTSPRVTAGRIRWAIASKKVKGCPARIASTVYNPVTRGGVGGGAPAAAPPDANPAETDREDELHHDPQPEDRGIVQHCGEEPRQDVRGLVSAGRGEDAESHPH